MVGTMGHAESEHAASILVRVCQVKGDAWGPISPQACGETLDADIAAKASPFFQLSRNPFFRPDFTELVTKGFAKWVAEARGPLEFTDKGLESLRAAIRR